MSNNSPLLRAVTDEECAQFQRDGVVCLRRIMAPEWVEIAREGIEAQRATPSPMATVVDADPLYMLIDQMPSHFNPVLRRVVDESGAALIAKRLAGDVAMRWMYDQLFYKGAGPVAETPWHQDTPYAPFDGHNIVRIWMPVDPVPRATTIEVVRGSHRWNVEYAVASKIEVLEQNQDKTQTGGFSYLDQQSDGRPELPAIEALRGSFDIVGHEVEPGDVVAFNYHVLHRAGPGMNPHAKRRAFAMLYADEAVGLKKRPNMVPSPLDVLGIPWQEGQKLGEFPELFRAL
ncbi:phytanoyl-CoA dioxygenase family protein [Pelomonas sp. SE-A7]|uniref:phytanoyl-CoA dioxygenase family protein n=1 Tax=Pelomonas sp. SE-A7 TaxID=3054953 RepID=UPI00259C968C|nr:phytanoyl-CoA dioxygenase family protein [Pelomonas sp. SE-A7]MDM4768344.1 phytanoyl-CoA dioxygenase family protein [Pelomonas sp. SE-A7]